ncbi:MFS transporter [Paenibacillus sp. Aloe-11]|uniref:MFS transporter n=1 Tax=Paenibacillus sp. Aloe-11 TaxID=1050222 RepID=UPI00024EF676|nr:MFS transporter [Paenibacillus sp. Aloe-11]EHS55640.1 major facilitator superfamily MFS_1 [Paenibacillus sp. Aloe-11]
MTYIQKGSRSFRKTSLAMFAGGFSTFALLYCMQPLMPEFSKDFGISPATASLSLSISTIAMAVTMLFVGILSDQKGRKIIMCCSLVGASAVGLLLTLSSGFLTLLILRMIQGMILAGLPAIAMTYLSEEINPAHLGYAMGLYISGNSIGGMGGRILTSTLTDLANWRTALGILALLSIVSSVLFWQWLPASRNFKRRKVRFSDTIRTLFVPCKDPALLCLYGLGFVFMGSFVTLFNYIGYRLSAPPYLLGSGLIGWIFVVYIMGTVSSTWMGRQSDRYGRYAVMGVAIGILLLGALLTLTGSLWVMIIGIALFTFGFFGGHSIASSWVGLLALEHRAQSSALYLFFYYTGSSISGTLGGIFYASFGWNGVILMITGYMTVALILNVVLKRRGASRNTTGKRPDATRTI